MLNLNMRSLAVTAASAVVLLGAGGASASTVIQGFSTFGANGSGQAVEADSFLYTPTFRVGGNAQCAPDDPVCLNEDNGNGGGEAGLVTRIYETDGAGEGNIVNNGFSYLGQYLNFNGTPPSTGNFYEVTGYDWDADASQYVGGPVVNFDTSRTYADYKTAYTGIRIYRETGSELSDTDNLTFQSQGFFITYGSIFSNVDRISLFGQGTAGQSRSDCLATAHETGVSFGSITGFNGCTPTNGGGGGGPSPVPVPAGLPLLLSALGIGAFVRSRGRKSA
jgi:hypothetical protein